MGSNHSLTPCAASTGTVVSMDGFTKIVKIDTAKKTLTAQAGLQLVDAAAAIRKKDLQFMLNIEIGNITLGSAACCQTKDSLDGVELGQVNSYVTGIKWVSPSGELMEASESKNPQLLPYIRASYGLAGIVYEVTFKLKPLEIISFDYDVHDVEDLKDSTIKKAISENQSIVMWTIGDDVVIQSRNKAKKLKHEFLADAREFGWNFLAAYTGRGIRDRFGGHGLGKVKERLGGGTRAGVLPFAQRGRRVHARGARQDDQLLEDPAVGALCLHLLGVPAGELREELQGLREVGRRLLQADGFRCNMPLGSYFIRKDRSSLLSYTWDGDIISLDPIHAPSEREPDAWPTFLKAFNEWAHSAAAFRCSIRARS